MCLSDSEQQRVGSLSEEGDFFPARVEVRWVKGGGIFSVWWTLSSIIPVVFRCIIISYQQF